MSASMSASSCTSSARDSPLTSNVTSSPSPLSMVNRPAETAAGVALLAQPDPPAAPSSPALARSVPSSETPDSPEGAGPFVYLTTEMANQAAMDYQQHKFANIFEWQSWNQKRLQLQRQAGAAPAISNGGAPPVGQPAVAPSPVPTVAEGRASVNAVGEPTQQAEAERKTTKRKGEEPTEYVEVKRDRPSCSFSSSSEVAEKPVYLDLGAMTPSSSSSSCDHQHQQGNKKDEMNPLKKMEQMTNSSVFQSTSSISEVVSEPLTKKDERSAKLEKLGGIEKDVQAEQAKHLKMQQQQHQMWLQNQHMERVRQQQQAGLSPSHPIMHPGIMPGYPGAPMPGPLSAGAYPSPYGIPPMPFHPGMPMPGYPGHPLSGMSPSASPSPFPPMMHPGMRGPPIPPGHPLFPQMMQQMQQHQQMQMQQQQQQHMAAVKARQSSRPSSSAPSPAPPLPHPLMMSAPLTGPPLPTHPHPHASHPMPSPLSGPTSAPVMNHMSPNPFHHAPPADAMSRGMYPGGMLMMGRSGAPSSMDNPMIWPEQFKDPCAMPMFAPSAPLDFPSPSFNPPLSSFAQPSPSFNPPPSSFAHSSPSFNPPPSAFPLPSPSYNPPSSSYNSPSCQMGALPPPSNNPPSCDQLPPLSS